MDKITSPYIDTEQYSRIALNSYQMDTDILINIKFNLVKKVENRCNKNGFIFKENKILENKNGIINPENFNSTDIFDIKYSCKLCIPIESTTIICQIRNINKANNKYNIELEKHKECVINSFNVIEQRIEILFDTFKNIHQNLNNKI